MSLCWILKTVFSRRWPRKETEPWGQQWGAVTSMHIIADNFCQSAAEVQKCISVCQKTSKHWFGSWAQTCCLHSRWQPAPHRVLCWTNAAYLKGSFRCRSLPCCCIWLWWPKAQRHRKEKKKNHYAAAALEHVAVLLMCWLFSPMRVEAKNTTLLCL